MSIRGIVGSFSESHRAKNKRPDRRIFLSQTGLCAADFELPATDPANAHHFKIVKRKLTTTQQFLWH